MELIPEKDFEVTCAGCGKKIRVKRRRFDENMPEYDFNEVALSVLEGNVPDLFFDPRWLGLEGQFISAPHIERCEHCHYVNTNITKKLHDKVHILIQKPEYQNIFKSGYDDFQIHDWLAYLYLLDNYYFDESAEEQENTKNYMYEFGTDTVFSSISGRKLIEIYSVAYLRLLDEIAQALEMELTTEEKLYLEKTKSEYTLRFMHHLQKSWSLIDKLRLAELYRRNGDFSKASEIIAEIENNEESIFGMLRKQKELISNKDSTDDGFPYRVY